MKFKNLCNLIEAAATLFPLSVDHPVIFSPDSESVVLCIKRQGMVGDIDHCRYPRVSCFVQGPGMFSLLSWRTYLRGCNWRVRLGTIGGLSK